MAWMAWTILRVLVWVAGNSLLAWIPVFLAHGVARGVDRDLAGSRPVRWAIWGPMLLLWLLFLPNGAYLLTEWRHYLTLVNHHSAFYQVYHDHHYAPVPTAELLVATAFFGLYSGMGLVATALSLWPLERLAARFLRTGPLVALVCVLCSAGVYMGLVDRLNSWQFFTPHTIRMAFVSMEHILTHPGILATVLLFAVFLRLVYAAFKVFMIGVGASTGPVAKRIQATLASGAPHRV